MRRRLSGGLLALPLLLGLAVAGCGGADAGAGVATAGDGGGGATPSASAVALSDDERRLKFTQCMRDNGVDLPDPEPGEGMRFRFGGNVDQKKVQAAMEECRSLLPNGGERLKMNPEQVEQMRQLAKCMRENGVPDFPDPQADGTMGTGGVMIDRNDPKMQAALEKCRQYAPKLGQGRGGDR